MLNRKSSSMLRPEMCCLYSILIVKKEQDNE
jgi:hypothetical protein